MLSFRPRYVLVLAALVAGAGWSYLKLESTGADMTESATKYLATLDPAQKAKSLLAYDAPNRVDWHFIPKEYRKGLQLRDMNTAQREAAHTLLKSCLSEVGYDKAVKIMALENLLRELEKARKGSPFRDPERYFFTVFGAPQEKGRWGLSIEGHHLCLNFVVENNHVISSTPTVFCANPATVLGEVPDEVKNVKEVKKGLRILAQEEQLAFDLLASLDADQAKAAVIADVAPKEVRDPGVAQPPQDKPDGIAASALKESQQKALRSLIEAYAKNLPGDVANERLAAIDKAGFAQVHFAWAGARKPGVGHYYRVQGPTFQIEFVNTQPDAAGNPANHIHCMWRDPAGDFAIPAGRS